MLEPTATSLTGKVALVTGGGGGMGRAIAETFAAHGARVAIAEIDAQRAADTVERIEKMGGEARASVLDIREKAAVAEFVGSAKEAFGRLDVLVNNVGDFLGITSSFANNSEADWEALYDINLKHVFRCSQAVIPHLVEQGEGGSIISISTIEAFRGIPGNVVYSAFNAGISGFTRSLGVELGPVGIRVNAIAPETTDTLQIPIHHWIPDKYKDRVPYWTPLGRFGTPDDAAGCALFLASDLSAWVTGTTVHMDGGALAAGGFYRGPKNGWTNLPIVDGAALGSLGKD